jgi:hypothetical protein
MVFVKYWPVPDSHSKIVPASGSQGAFWEDRGDRYHCGVDIYAREGSNVLSIEDGKVLDVGIFTSRDRIPYWNTTSYILIENVSGLLCKYAELGDVMVNVGESVRAGQLIGHVGLVLDSDKIVQSSPLYIQKLKTKGNNSMLHFELFGGILMETTDYLGGNWFGKTKPENLHDPTDYLMSLLEMKNYRVFISYSHEDEDLAMKIVDIMENIGLSIIWDKKFSFGRGFQEQIKNFIAHAHVFLPIITKSSSEKGWVHQEIGYAMALNVPVLPVARGTLPGEMIRELHAVQFDDPEELKYKLSTEIIHRLVCSYQDTPLAMFQCAELNEDRAIMMIKYANDVLQLGEHGFVRQKGGLTSFHIPDKIIRHPIWMQRTGEKHQKSEFYNRCVRKERLALEEHARIMGCRLIINPYLLYEMYGDDARKSRLESLIEFLESMPDDKVQVAINRNMVNENITIVGDWFAAESVSAFPGRGYRQTIFTRHAPNILEKIGLFDLEFNELIRNLKWTAELSKSAAINTINGILIDLKEKKARVNVDNVDVIDKHT